MTAAIVPLEHLLWHVLRFAESQDALHITCLKVIVFGGFTLVTDSSAEESRRRQLPIIADNRHLLSTSNGTKCIDGPNLAGLVDEQ